MAWHTVQRKHFLPTLTLIPLLAVAFLPQILRSDEPSAGKRQPWKTSRVVGSPEPPLPYSTERAFPAIQFSMCLDMVTFPSSDRWFVVEQYGKIFSFLKDEQAAKADLVIDFAKAIPGIEQVYSLAFHPDFANNRLCYVCLIMAPDLADGT
ncbi:MAG: hypothetical protein ABI557_21430, partial [Aureliella sp.]